MRSLINIVCVCLLLIGRAFRESTVWGHRAEEGLYVADFNRLCYE